MEKMQFDIALGLAAQDYLNREGRRAPVVPPTLRGFEALWRRLRPQQGAPLAAGAPASVAAPRRRSWRRTFVLVLAMAALLTVTVSAAVDVDAAKIEKAFAALRALMAQPVQQEEFTVTPEEIAAYHVDEVGFIINGEEYSTAPTLKEMLLHGWQVESVGGTVGRYEQDETFVSGVDGYRLVKGDCSLDVGLYEEDIFKGIEPKECRVSSLVIQDEQIGQMESLQINGLDLLHVSAAALQEAWGKPYTIKTDINGTSSVLYDYRYMTPAIYWIMVSYENQEAETLPECIVFGVDIPIEFAE